MLTGLKIVWDLQLHNLQNTTVGIVLFSSFFCFCLILLLFCLLVCLLLFVVVFFGGGTS